MFCHIVCQNEHLTQRLVELGHLGMIPACCLGLVAGKGQKRARRSDAELAKALVLVVKILH